MGNFVLPEKWYVERTEQNADVINKWACELQGSHHAYRNTNCYFLNDGTYKLVISSDIYEFIAGHIKITYEEFVKYVINQETDEINQSEDYNQILIKLLTNG